MRRGDRRRRADRPLDGLLPPRGRPHPRHPGARGGVRRLRGVGRNGGWLSSELAGSARTYAERGGRGRRRAAACRAAGDGRRGHRRSRRARASRPTSCAAACSWSRARGPRPSASTASSTRTRWPSGSGSPVRSPGHFDPDCARVHPARLVGGVARVVRERGVAHPRGHPRRTHRAGCGGHRARHRPRPRRAALPRGLHRRARRPPPRLAADELRDRGDRAADRRAVARRSAGAARSCSATRRTPTATPSAPPTAASPSAAAASPTASAPAPTSTAAPRTGRSSRCARR